jgi:hypothetical protein
VHTSLRLSASSRWADVSMAGYMICLPHLPKRASSWRYAITIMSSPCGIFAATNVRCAANVWCVLQTCDLTHNYYCCPKSLRAVKEWQVGGGGSVRSSPCSRSHQSHSVGCPRTRTPSWSYVGSPRVRFWWWCLGLACKYLHCGGWRGARSVREEGGRGLEEKPSRSETLGITNIRGRLEVVLGSTADGEDSIPVPKNRWSHG